MIVVLLMRAYQMKIEEKIHMIVAFVAIKDKNKQAFNGEDLKNDPLFCCF